MVDFFIEIKQTAIHIEYHGLVELGPFPNTKHAETQESCFQF